MGNTLFTPSSTTNTDADTETAFLRRVDDDIRRAYPDMKKEKILTEYYVATHTVPFYMKDSSGRLVERTEETTPAGECVSASRGDCFTGSSLKQQVFVDLGFNTYLPLNDTDTGHILLQTTRQPNKDQEPEQKQKQK